MQNTEKFARPTLLRAKPSKQADEWQTYDVGYFRPHLLKVLRTNRRLQHLLKIIHLQTANSQDCNALFCVFELTSKKTRLHIKLDSVYPSWLQWNTKRKFIHKKHLHFTDSLFQTIYKLFCQSFVIRFSALPVHCVQRSMFLTSTSAKLML